MSVSRMSVKSRYGLQNGKRNKVIRSGEDRRYEKIHNRDPLGPDIGFTRTTVKNIYFKVILCRYR